MKEKKKHIATVSGKKVYSSEKKGMKYFIPFGSDGYHFKTRESLNKFFGDVEDVKRGPDNYPYRYGGSMYRLSNGETIRGKAEAFKAQKSINNGE